MSTRELIDAIESNDTIAIQTNLEKELAGRIAEKLDIMRQDVAKDMFGESVISPKKRADMDRVNAGAMSKADYDKKWSKEAVYKRYNMGTGRDKTIKEDEELDESKKNILVTDKQAKKLMDKHYPGHTVDSDKEGKTYKHDGKVVGTHASHGAFEYNHPDKSDGTVKHSEIHVKDHPTKTGHFTVHAVGKKWKSHVKTGDTLNDTQLDDFSEVGGKVKHLGD